MIRVNLSTCGSGSNRRVCSNPVVRFVTARGQVIEFTSHVSASYSVGDSVKVRYDPNNPCHARLDSLWDRVAAGVLNVLGLLAGLAVAVGGGVLFRLSGGEAGRLRRPGAARDLSARPRRRAARRRRRVRHRRSGGAGG